ncbi:zinc ribbon domain-containing protein [Rhizomonospora bruguierae]|uniref:zinc ribbon domain-containing protein n=1 Tax=Rhizomonospora bruguierae TaxID=1581705 RepID=UPI001BCF02F1|nr:zinc ribbon domain-containing protein [Micromonospora sp. NBRC 107566]
MIICQVCGTRNAADERFCGQCGAFLAWDGAVVDHTATSPAGAEHPVPVGGAARPGGEPATVGTSPVSPAAPAPPEPGAAPVSPAVPPPRESAASPVSPAPTPAASASTPAPAGEGAAPEAAERIPPERRPGQAARRRPVVQEVPDRPAPPRPGDLVCGRCGSGNDPARRFCRSCGASLAEAAPVKLHWWQRLWRRLSRPAKYAAGERRRRRAGPIVGRLTRILALLLAAALAVAFGPSLVRRGVNEVRDRTRKHEPISATGFAASSARRDNPAARIGDGKNNRYWAPAGRAQGAWVEATFPRPLRILDIIVTPGVSPNQDEFVAAGRPHELDVLATPDRGEPTRFTLTLSDAPGPQTFHVTADRAVRIRFTVRSVFGANADPVVAIAEVEFYGRP